MHRTMSPRTFLIAGAATIATGLVTTIVFTLLSDHLFVFGCAPIGVGTAFLVRGAIGVAGTAGDDRPRRSGAHRAAPTSETIFCS